MTSIPVRLASFENAAHRRAALLACATLSCIAALASPARAHSEATGTRPALHVGYAYKSCYIDLHPELTAGQLKDFSREFAAAGAFLSMSGARSLPRWHVGLGLTYSQTFIDDTRPQWNNTFSHPGEQHWLGRPALPIVHARIGLPRAFEGEVMFTGDPRSNWALLAAAVRAPVLSELAGSLVSAAVRLEYSHLLGAQEVDVDSVALGGLVSRSFGRFTPYAGAAAFVARGTERTPELALGSQTAFGARATAGLEVALGPVRVAGQGAWSPVPIVALMVGGVI